MNPLHTDNHHDLLLAMEELEHNAGALYLLFAYRFPEDRAFWLQLHREESDHARICLDFGQQMIDAGPCPQLPACTLETLAAINDQVRKLIADYSRRAPSRQQACLAALQLEQAAGERHYLPMLERLAGQTGEAILGRIVAETKDHERRIRERLADIVKAIKHQGPAPD